MAFTYRIEKGSPLTEQELDDNFREVANIAQITADEINKKVTADTNEAKKRANEAAKQALKAKDEADRASQITGLDTVADAIGLAAVPFPDVWIPFNDSLRMLAGFGRDVKIGADVVATYVNYERATTATYIDKSGVLRTAAVNEPRFERQGLLIEGQSTNLFLNSEIGASQSIATQADKYTISFYGAGSVSITGSATLSLSGTGANERVSKAFDCSAGNLAIEITGRVTRVQLEKLPFASSYIPTNGAAVTRAADKCWVRSAGNVAQSGEMSFAVSVNDILGVPAVASSIVCPVSYDANGSSRFVWFNTLDPATGGCLHGSLRIGEHSYNSSAALKFDSGIIALSNSNSSIIALTGGRVTKIDVLNAFTYVDSVDVFFGRRQNSGGDGLMFGHIRNFRMWHSALSDAQIKGLK